MNDVVEEWRQKAEGDFLTAARELRVTERPNYDAVCFHAQQCVEKLMEALLTLRGQQPPCTHDLVRLNELLQAAVGFSHPAESAGYEEARLRFAWRPPFATPSTNC